MPKVEFGRLQDARQVRNDPLLSSFLAAADDGRSPTVVLKDGIPDSALSKIRGEAAESRQHERQEAGQIPLTDEERRQVDFSQPGVNVPKARSIKGIAENEGVDDFLQFADFTLTVDENRTLLERAQREERGKRMDATTDENKLINKEAEAFRAQQQQELPQAKEFAFKGDREAQEFVSEQGPAAEVFDISLRREETAGGNTLRGSGQDFARIAELHEERSERAQRLDERKQAPVTRDPFEWRNNMDEFDFPGVDTVDPASLHNQRPKKAREVDESQLAPIADSKEEWAADMDGTDWPGVDTPQSREGGSFDDNLGNQFDTDLFGRRG